jgi:hypothetical protein
MKKFFLLLFVIPFGALAQKELSVTSTPADADIYNLSLGTAPVKAGTGTIKLKLEKDKPVVLEARKEGFVPVQKTFLRKKDGEANETIELVDRIVQINASPADASIFVNDVDKGKTPQYVIIHKGESITVEVKKRGLVSQSKTYSNSTSQEIPEISSLFKLEDRLVSIKTIPQDATIYVDDKKKADGNAQVIIPKDKCVIVKVEKAGYMPNEVTYCNKESEVIPPFSDEIKLKDRKIQINVLPEDAKIFVDGKEVGKGNYSIKIPLGKCTEVLIVKPSFVTERYDLCNQTDVQQPDPAYSIKMKEDEAYQQSEESSIANKNFSVTPEGAISPAESWKKLVSIIQTRFDEIETIDASTNYLKTNWVGKTFNKGSAFSSMIRTRVIITNGGTNNSYNIKIQSEISKADSDCSRASSNGDSGQRHLTATMDECFEPVDRILRKYSDLISEIQRRLK